MRLDGSDPEFNTVLVRSPNVFWIFSVQISRFLAEIYDFVQLSWAPVQDFSKNTLLLERYLCIVSIFPCFSPGFCMHPSSQGSSKGTPRTTKMNIQFIPIASTFDTEKIRFQATFCGFTAKCG